VLRVWEVDGGMEVFSLRRPGLGVNGVALSPDGRTLAAACEKGVKLYDVETGEERLTVDGGGYGVAFSPDGRRLIAGYTLEMGGRLCVWDVVTGQRLLTLRGQADPKQAGRYIEGGCLAISPDGLRIALDARGGAIKVFEARPE
jgi:WD40 repeat protein